MRAIVVDDNQKYKEKLKAHLKRKLGFASVDKGLKAIDYRRASAYEIAQQVNESARGEREELLVFINLNLTCADVPRQRQAGAEVLHHLRLSDSFFDKHTRLPVENVAKDVHCVVYSFNTFEQVFRQRPESLTLAAGGTTFLQLPHDFAGLKFSELAARRPRADSLRRYVGGGSFVPNDRHNQANWWGVKQLWDVHRIVIDAANRRYPSDVIYERLREPENQVVKCLYGHTGRDLESAYEPLAQNILERREELSRRLPRVLHIDDNWENGWSKVFQNMLLSEKQVTSLQAEAAAGHFETKLLGGVPVFRSYKMFGEEGEVSQKVELVAERVRELIAAEGGRPPDVILLDLRLFSAQEEPLTEVGQLSGALVLARLRAEFMGVPVIMTTASNKARSFEGLIRLGADGYWIKEGLDARNNPADSVKNYLRFLELIDLATGEKYRFFKTLHRVWSDLKNKSGHWVENRAGGDHWWEDHTWTTKSGATVRIQADTVFISKTLDETLLMLRTYLHNFEMGYGFSNADKQFWVGAIIRHAALIGEAVHRQFSTDAIYQRSDWAGVRLKDIRNRATHVRHRQSGTYLEADWPGLVRFLKYLSCYLYHGPQAAFERRMSLEDMGAASKCYADLLNQF